MEETRFRSFGQIITNLFKEGQKGILWLYLVFIPGAFVRLLMINSSVSQLQKSTFGLVYLQKREIYCMIIITMVALPSFCLHEFARNLEQKCCGAEYFIWDKNLWRIHKRPEWKINWKSVLNSCLTFKKPLKELWACAVKSMIYSNCLECDGWKSCVIKIFLKRIKIFCFF